MRDDDALKIDLSPVRGMRVMIALSGGADSVALAVMLAEARTEYDMTLFAAHVDHGIRPESAEDAEFCRALCRQLDISFFCQRVDVPAEAARTGMGVETVARNLRRAALERFFHETHSDCIALAHHMDDQVETVLMHLARGAGLEGAGGMRPLSEDSRLFRPLLGLRKAALMDYLRARGFTWREDATNRVADNPRNALRLNVIPEIERWYPGFVGAVSRFAETARIEGDLVEQLTADYLETCGDMGPFCAWLTLAPPPHPAILRRAIRARCPEELYWAQVRAVEDLCTEPRGKLDIGANTYAERTGSRLYFVPKRPPAIREAPLSLDGETPLPPLGTLTAVPWQGGPIRDDPMAQALNPGVLRGAVLRTRRPGDRIRPLGGGDKLLSDYFIDRKVDRPLRDAMPVIAVENRVHWVVGLGISQEAALKPGESAVRFGFNYKK